MKNILKYVLILVLVVSIFAICYNAIHSIITKIMVEQLLMNEVTNGMQIM